MEIQDVDFSEMFLLSVLLHGLFTNISVTKTIDVAVSSTFERNTGSDFKLSKIQLFLFCY